MQNKRFGLDINATYKCNFRCGYCYEQCGEKHSKFDKNLIPDVLKLITNISNNRHFSENNSGIQLNFWGGEPTLNMPLIETIIEHTQYNREISYFIYTNGSNIESIIDLYKKYNLNKTSFGLQISYDGQFLQDKYRRSAKDSPTSSLVMSSILRAIEEKLPFSVKSTIAYTEFEYLFPTFIEFVMLNEVSKDKLNMPLIYSPSIDTFNTASSEEYEKYISTLTDSINKIYQYHESHFANQRSIFSWLNPQRAVCAAGSNLLALDTNGDILTCHGCFYLEDRNAHVISNIRNLDVVEKLAKWSQYHKQFVQVMPLQCLNCETTICIKCNAHVYNQSKLTGYVSKWTDYTQSAPCFFFKHIGNILKFRRGVCQK